MKTFNDFINSIKDQNDLTVNESKKAFDQILSKKIEEKKIIDFLTSLSRKGESVNEILGAVKSIKKKAKIISGFKNSLDTCGTGGDGSKTFNISTTVAIICSSCNVCIAKHGNKAVSSLSGSADVMTELGVKIDIDQDTIKKCLKEIGLCFLFAPNFHPILKNVAEIRKSIGKRTIFNILGPLLNPVESNMQLIGVYDKDLKLKVAEVLKQTGSKKAWVVSGFDGLDELTITDKNYIVELDNGKIKEFILDPSKIGITKCKKNELIGNNPKENAKIILDILSNKINGAKKDIVLYNCAAALMIAGKTESISSGFQMANEAIKSGSALNKLNNLIKISNNQ